MNDLKTTLTVEHDDGYEMDLAITFDYQPAEPQRADCPAVEADIDCIEALHEGLCVYGGQWDKQIEQACWDHVNAILFKQAENRQVNAEMAAEARMEMYREERA